MLGSLEYQYALDLCVVMACAAPLQPITVIAHTPPDLRDLLPVCGWNDKAFAYLTSQLTPSAAQTVRDDLPLKPSTHACQLRGVLGTYEEDQQQLSFRQGSRMLYLWRKGASVPEVCDPVLYVK